ncbi:hypothetical protein VHA_002238 [Grimontia hollisae CIP 101886]|uniref:Uncharacterized protein n=1 Tax=Grimontia hollisae CIP 101886 TaxID=675812 RepID=D0I9V1_GRIHO|nr:hypothetical protein VHA_002238 [Grimontia hollisae CIP 101886]
MHKALPLGKNGKSMHMEKNDHSGSLSVSSNIFMSGEMTYAIRFRQR